MPICNKPSLALSQTKCATKLNDHASEAAKMKRTREQAYFNSYNFDAIHVPLHGHNIEDQNQDQEDEGEEEEECVEYDDDNGKKLKVICSGNSQQQHNTLEATIATTTTTTRPTTLYHGTSSSLTSTQSNRSSSGRSSVCSDSQRSDQSCDTNASSTSTYLRHHQHSNELSYAYMQRFGTILMHSRNQSPSSELEVEAVGVVEGIAKDIAPIHGMCETAVSQNENFLLPRAMLNYQSVGNVNSMPLAGNNSGRADKLLQNGYNYQYGNNNNNNNSSDNKSNNYNNNKNNNSASSYNKYSSNNNNKSNSNGGKTLMMTTNAINKKCIHHNNNNSNNKSSLITNTTTTKAINISNKSNSNNSHTTNSSHSNNTTKNRLNYVNANKNHSYNNNTNNNNNNNNINGYASLLVANNEVNANSPYRATKTTAQTTTAMVATKTAETSIKLPLANNCVPGIAMRIKKPSTSSTNTTTTNASSEHEENNDNIKTKAQRTNTKGTTTHLNDTKTAQSCGSERRGRTNSHQSHYSTDKSGGSSGYYSSNVCSTYSLDEHIYCEPVTDILHVNNENSKSAIARSVNAIANSDSKKKQKTTTRTTTVPTLTSLTQSYAHEMSNRGVSKSSKRGYGQRHGGPKTATTTTTTTTTNSRNGGESGIALGDTGEMDSGGSDGEDDCDGDGSCSVEPDGRGGKLRDVKEKNKCKTNNIPASLQFLLERQSSGEHHASQNFSENLRVLETSIENLDRHLKNFPSLTNHEHIAAFVQSHHHNHHQHHHHEHQQQPTHIQTHQNHHTFLHQHLLATEGGREKLASTMRIPHQNLHPTSHSYAHHLHHHHHQSTQQYLPTIMEGYDPAAASNQQTHHSWSNDMVDDSLLDIDLDSFLLVNERKAGNAADTKVRAPINRESGIDNPTFLTEEQEKENNYKCVKYINSCPDDAYRVESDLVASITSHTTSEKSISLADHYMKRYEDQLHFQSTRELLEDVRDKIRLLSRASDSGAGTHSDHDHEFAGDHVMDEQQLPHELEAMINTLKKELENYLDRMNQHSELEIRQLCSGLVRNHNIVKMKKAFERRRSSLSTNDSDYGCYSGNYEAICDGGVPTSIREQILSIRCASDPNFKMKRKSLTEVFPVVDCYTESDVLQHNASRDRDRDCDCDQDVITLHGANATQLQRNLSFQQPILNKLDAKSLTTTTPTTATLAIVDAGVSDKRNSNNGSGNSARGGSNGSATESGESGDKDSILEWHRKKPSIWEMYYGTNRMNQSLLGKRNGVVGNNNNTNNEVTMSYPSSRPESDFTLDLPRAEQLRIKMEKEKKFRQRCRYITTFLSLVFFLLTVMVVSLVLTRGKRMFGSMI